MYIYIYKYVSEKCKASPDQIPRSDHRIRFREVKHMRERHKITRPHFNVARQLRLCDLAPQSQLMHLRHVDSTLKTSARIGFRAESTLMHL